MKNAIVLFAFFCLSFNITAEPIPIVIFKFANVEYTFTSYSVFTNLNHNIETIEKVEACVESVDRWLIYTQDNVYEVYKNYTIFTMKRKDESPIFLKTFITTK